ncbi:ankyrin [Zalerion maritima]|uniref:Ankyrin n=1 Tax=Zalerion maritima TaxID=339359 RepID=A0AAD5RFB2_9PEZI|nr:ankyrin [Zalerion maritima]
MLMFPQKSSSSRLTSLPVELLLEIVENVVLLSSPSSSFPKNDPTQSLMSLSLTSHTFRTLCNPLIYLVDNSTYPMRSLAYALEEDNLPVLEWLVHMHVATARSRLGEDEAEKELVNWPMGFRSGWVRRNGLASPRVKGRVGGSGGIGDHERLNWGQRGGMLRDWVQNLNTLHAQDSRIRSGRAGGRLNSLVRSHGFEKKRPFVLAPLHIAAKSGNLSACQFLVSHGADISILGDERHDSEHSERESSITHLLGPQTAIHMALEGGHDQVVLFLLSADKDRAAGSGEGGNHAIAQDIWGNEITLLNEVVRLRKAKLLRRMLQMGLVTPQEIKTARDKWSLGGVEAPLVLLAAAGYHDPEMTALLLENGADGSEVLRVPGSVFTDPTPQGRVWEGLGPDLMSEENRLSWLSMPSQPRSAHLQKGFETETEGVDHVNTEAYTPTPVEALCNGGIQSYLRDRVPRDLQTQTADETALLPDSVIDEMYQTLMVLLSRSDCAKELRKSNRLDCCLQGLIDNALGNYRCDLNLGRFATAILEAAQPSEFFYGDSITIRNVYREGDLKTPFFLPYLTQSLMTLSFPLLSSLSSHITSHPSQFTHTISQFLPLAARLIAHLSGISPQLLNTLSPLSLTISPTWKETPKKGIWFPGTRVKLPNMSGHTPVPTLLQNGQVQRFPRSETHLIHVPPRLLPPASIVSRAREEKLGIFPGPEYLEGIQRYNSGSDSNKGQLNSNGKLKKNKKASYLASHDVAPSQSSLAALEGLRALRTYFEPWLVESGFWDTLRETKRRCDAQPEACAEEIRQWDIWNQNERIQFLLQHIGQGGLPDHAWHSWTVADLQSLTIPIPSPPSEAGRVREPFFVPGERFKSHRDVAVTETSLAELKGTANVPEIDFWQRQRRVCCWRG